MKKLSAGKIILLCVIGVIVLFGIGCVGGYNSLVGLQESVTSQRSNIETQLQRRADLIPNLVSTVKGYASHETEIMTQISNARANLSGASTLKEKADANGELTSALNRLMVIVENYPDLKANTQFSGLMDELAGTENRIAVSRLDYNNAVKTYNQKIKTFPSVIIAKIFGFNESEYFEASAGAENAPQVSFE